MAGETKTNLNYLIYLPQPHFFEVEEELDDFELLLQFSEEDADFVVCSLLDEADILLEQLELLLGFLHIFLLLKMLNQSST